jgi:hypothetical protein
MTDTVDPVATPGAYRRLHLAQAGRALEAVRRRS